MWCLTPEQVFGHTAVVDRTRVRWRRLGVVMVVTSLGLALFGARAGAGTPRRSLPQRTYVVQPGDTVWAIARRSVGPSGDPRRLVDRLIQVNRLHGAVVFPGERLVMPPSDSPSRDR